MYTPGFFGENLFDEFFDDFVTNDKDRRMSRRYQLSRRPMPPAQPMRTDVKESDSGYELDIELPGVNKEDISVELKDGYLTISASTDTTNEEKDENGSFIRRERFVGKSSRSFCVGEDVTEEEIGAKFENGVLKLAIPKKEAKLAVEKKHYIQIED